MMCRLKDAVATATICEKLPRQFVGQLVTSTGGVTLIENAL